MQMPLTTPRLILRRFTTADLPDLIALHRDPEVMRYITAGQPDDPAKLQHEVLPRWMQHDSLYAGWGFFAAELVDTHQFAGWFHLNPVPDSPGEFDIGWRLRRELWNRGLATEGAQHLLAQLAWSNQAKRIIARTMAGNTASKRVMEKLGLTFEGEYQETRFPGECQCATRYSMDWSTIIHRRVWLCRQGLNHTTIAQLPSGWLVMGDNQTLPGYTLLLSDPVQQDLNHCDLDYRALFLRDMSLVGDAVLKATGARLMNYMILQNTDHALHAHIHARYENEPADKRPTGPWAYMPPHPETPFNVERDQPLMDRIRDELHLCIR